MEPIDFAPNTRLTLLKAVRDDPASARWGEFYAVYRPFLARCLAKFPWVSPEDREEVVDDVFLELVRSFPDPGAMPGGCRFRQYIQTKLHGKLQDKIRRNTKLSRTGAAQKVLAEHGESLPELTFEEVGERMRETLARYADWAVRAIDDPAADADDSPEEAAALVHALLDGVFS
jgi:DNA-directed RNA polymerase specialized sigma24 family protein